MEAALIVICIGILIVGLIIAAGLQSLLVNLATKAVAVGVLAVMWKAIPRIYDENFRGPEADLLAALQK